MLNNIWMREYNSGTAIGFGYGSSGAQVYTGKLSVGYSYGTAAPSNSLIVYGNVGIGTTNPSEKLEVAGNALIDQVIGRTNNDLYLRGNFLLFKNKSGDAEYMRITSAGNVGIGTTAPSDFKLQVAGSIGPDSAPSITSQANTCTTIDSANIVGRYTSIAIGTDGLPVISYYDYTNGDLRVCKCSNTSCTSATCTTIDSANDVGYHTSIAIGTDGLPVISEYDYTNGDLRVCKCSNTSCTSATCTTIDSANDVGQYSSIAIGTDGLPVISHYDVTNGDLRVCKCSNTSCTSATCSTIDSANNVGQLTSIAIGTDGLPVISEYDATNGDLRVCKCSNTSCTSATCTTIDSANNVGMYTSIAIGTDGLPVISHFDYTNRDLRVCKCSNTSCTSATCTTIDSANDVGYHTSIAIGTDGLPVISHRDATNGDLRVCKCSNTSCTSATCTTIDSANNVGMHTSIAIGTDGLPVISHYDATNGVLRVCKLGSPSGSYTPGYYLSGGSDLGSRGKFFNNVYAATYWGRNFQISDFADIAEEYPVSDPSIEAGDVVSVSSTGQIGKSQSAYDEKIIGVISSQPAINLGLNNWSEESSSTSSTKRKSVALVGRVPVKVTTKNGEIKPGDLLTSSDIPGVAMKATEPGRVIGVALESLSDPDFENCGIENSLKIENCELKIGKILVFINPHWALGSLADDGNLMTNDLTTNDQKPTILDQFTLAIKKALEKLGLFLANGIAKIKEIFTEKITTKEICVKGDDGETICLTKDQVKELMNQKQIISGSGQTINNSQQTISSSSLQETSVSTTETTTTETIGAIETSTTTTENGESAGTTTETTETTTE